MRNGLIQLYSQKSLVDQFQATDAAMAMYFGKLGLEEHVLVLILRSELSSDFMKFSQKLSQQMDHC
jgi:hypothetical protein